MGLPLEKEREAPPGLQELVGVAVNASVLTFKEGHERPLDRIAALGAAARSIALDLDRERVICSPQPGHAVGAGAERKAGPNADGEYEANPLETDRLAARLAPLLWRLKFGGDATRETALDAVHGFAAWMGRQRYWRNDRGNVTAQQLQLFAARVICEWLSDKCAACGGTGLQELLRNGMTRRPRRFGAPDVRHVKCRACHGSRVACVHANARAQALAISFSDYKAHWPRRFDLAAAWLRGIANRLKKPLQSELERGKNRS